MERSIARYNERITFQKNTVTVDMYKNHKPGWKNYFSCYTYASTYQYDHENNGVVVSQEQTINFEVRYCSELKDLDSTLYRVVFHGRVYDIDNIDWMNYQRKKIRVRCKLTKESVSNG